MPRTTNAKAARKTKAAAKRVEAKSAGKKLSPSKRLKHILEAQTTPAITVKKR